MPMGRHKIVYVSSSSHSFFPFILLHQRTDGSVDGTLLNKTQDPSGLIKHFSTKRATDRANECLMVADIHASVVEVVELIETE